MEKAYDEALDDSFAAVEKTNFYDACYSPVILIMNAAVVALVMLLSAAGSPEVRAFFGMSGGTAVAVIAYISQVRGSSTACWRRQSAFPPLKPPRRPCRVPPAWSCRTCILVMRAMRKCCTA